LLRFYKEFVYNVLYPGVISVTYLASWVEGNEVIYKLVNEKELAELWEPEKNFIVVKLH